MRTWFIPGSPVGKSQNTSVRHLEGAGQGAGVTRFQGVLAVGVRLSA
jgi:hypothetical protein